ncbi:MAG: hypothetical protein DCF24_00625 [Cyanobium sp.]|nr:MAG: hypothetical protein DCF24_00625 [Cyanobium sp.]
MTWPGAHGQRLRFSVRVAGMDPDAAHSLSVLLWCGVVGFKLVRLGQRWRWQGGAALGRAFDLELRRRGWTAPSS